MARIRYINLYYINLSISSEILNLTATFEWKIFKLQSLQKILFKNKISIFLLTNTVSAHIERQLSIKIHELQTAYYGHFW